MSRLVLHEPLSAGMDRTIVIEDGVIASIGRHAPQPGDRVVDCTGKWITPALLDLHVHLREPGQEHKEDIETGCRDAIAGGVGALCCMPNTEPLAFEPATIDHIIRRATEVGRGVKVMPVAAAVKGRGSSQLSDYRALRDAGAAMISDDGFTITDEGLLRECLAQCAEAGITFAGHFELPGPDGLPNEPIAVERACRLAAATGARVHISHVSTAEGAGIILDAREDGAPITWEICPHHLLLTEDDIERLGAQGKVAPRLKTRRDTEALLQHAIDGEVDALVSDHAPHTDSEKSRPFDQAPPGMLGMGCMMSVSHKALWDKAADPDAWLRAVELWTDGPWSVLGAEGPKIEVGAEARLALFEFGETTVRPEWIHSRSSNCPYLGVPVLLKPWMTVLGRRAWRRDSLGRLAPLEGTGDRP